MKINKIWLSPKGLWRTKVYTSSGDLYDDIFAENLIDLINELRKIDRNNEKVLFDGKNNLGK